MGMGMGMGVVMVGGCSCLVVLNLNEFNELLYGFRNLIRAAVLQLKVLGLQVFWSKVKYL